MTEPPEVHFFRELRALKIQGYYTSKIGIHDDLDYKGNRMIVEFVGLLRRNQVDGQPSGKESYETKGCAPVRVRRCILLKRMDTDRCPAPIVGGMSEWQETAK